MRKSLMPTNLMMRGARWGKWEERGPDCAMGHAIYPLSSTRKHAGPNIRRSISPSTPLRFLGTAAWGQKEGDGVRRGERDILRPL